MDGIHLLAAEKRHTLTSMCYSQIAGLKIIHHLLRWEIKYCESKGTTQNTETTNAHSPTQRR